MRTSWAFHYQDLKEFNVLDATGELDCTLQNEIHPIFSEKIFQRAICPGRALRTVAEPYDPNVYQRLRPALLLASRILTDDRYLKFWATIVKEADNPVPSDDQAWTIHLIACVCPILARKTREQLCRLVNCLDGIGFGHGGVDTASSSAWTGWIDVAGGEFVFGIYLCAKKYQAVLEHKTWRTLGETGRTSFQLAIATCLVHEVAHAFSKFMFHCHGCLHRQVGADARLKYREPLLLGGDVFNSGQPEIGFSLNRYFLGGSLEAIGECCISPHKFQVRRSFEVGCCLLLPFDTLGLGPHSAFQEALIGTVPRTAVAIPNCYVKQVFTEEWFQYPYPKWYLDHFPSAFKAWIWGRRREQAVETFEALRVRCKRLPESDIPRRLFEGIEDDERGAIMRGSVRNTTWSDWSS
ncbi:MAG: hypothetical protein Q9227_007223 [Pyrenula ochraceoflavens]